MIEILLLTDKHTTDGQKVNKKTEMKILFKFVFAKKNIF